MGYPLLAAPPQGVDEAAWAAACAAVRAYCGWHIAPFVTGDVMRVKSSGRVIILPSLHVENVSEVSIRGSVVDPAQWELMPEPVIWLGRLPFGDLDYHLEWLSGVDTVGIGSTDRPLVATVTMDHGFDACPDDILGVLSDVVQYGSGSIFTQVGQVRHGSSPLVGAASVIRERAATLDPYRRPKLA